ncbi:hypothetical protein FOA43_000437 [Brettanomyces nanus]|uniref:ENTH domain-containing protein n=1 Tax=Eeniella nana TaxID=13502 RepID=A0A875RYZ3_EENNA|nr:uncharacterized protein FOA43_000437 [Brettanomyces nanus]QPG73132.1 hypothetical protein FOA43_000437 [Brettanomyces nanus]
MTTKSMLRSIKNVTNGYSSAQVMVRNATSNDASGPTVTQMADVANHTYDRGEFLEIMDIIDRRLNDKGKNWRHVAKSLTLLGYLVRYGSEDVVIWAKDNVYVVKTLREFQATDSMGQDQGGIVRVKARELTDLLADDERLRQEREAASRKSGHRAQRGYAASGSQENIPGENDFDLERAIEESKMTAQEEEEMRNRHNSDASIERAIQLSLEEDEMRKKKQNLLDLDDDTPVPPTVLGYYTGLPQPMNSSGQIVGYDMYGNPVYANQAMPTGYLQNAYQSAASQQQLLQEQQTQAQAQAQQLAAAQQQQQQQLYQQQLAAAQQQQQQQQLLLQQASQQVPMETGSNNPFAFNSQPTDTPDHASLERLQQQQRLQQLQLQQQAQTSAAPSAANQAISEQYAELNNLLAQGTGIDTFGNEGDSRIPAQHTKTGTFLNSSGTGFRQENGNSAGNPFMGTQFAGMPSTIVAAPTGYGFGNQQQSSSQKPPGSLIDL